MPEGDASTQRSQKRAGSTRIAIDMRDASILQITDPERLQGGNLVLNWFFPYIQEKHLELRAEFYQSYRDNAAAVYAQRNTHGYVVGLSLNDTGEKHIQTIAEPLVNNRLCLHQMTSVPHLLQSKGQKNIRRVRRPNNFTFQSKRVLIVVVKKTANPASGCHHCHLRRRIARAYHLRTAHRSLFLAQHDAMIAMEFRHHHRHWWVSQTTPTSTSCGSSTIAGGITCPPLLRPQRTFSIRLPLSSNLTASIKNNAMMNLPDDESKNGSQFDISEGSSAAYSAAGIPFAICRWNSSK
jgi:hypothetical protein